MLAVVCAAILWLNHSDRSASVAGLKPPWPVSKIFDTRHKTVIVVADGNYGMLRILTGQRGSLEQYLNRDFPEVWRTQIRAGRLSFCGLYF